MKKTIYGVILAVFFGFYIFFGNEFGGVNAKALTVDEIQTVDDLRGTTWVFNNDPINFSATVYLLGTVENTQYATYYSDEYEYSIVQGTASETWDAIITFSYKTTGSNVFHYLNMTYLRPADDYLMNSSTFYQKLGNNAGSWKTIAGTGEKRITFLNWGTSEVYQQGDFLNTLKANATLQEPEPEEYEVNIDWPILEETMLLTQGETVTINFDELMQTYKNYEYVDVTWSYNDNDIGNITLPLYYKLTGFYLTNTPVYSEDLFYNSGTLTFSEDIYLWAVSEPPDNYIFTKFSYIDGSLEGSVEDGYNLLIPFSDNEVNINWTYDDDMIVDITGLEGFKIAISQFDETSIDIIEYTYSSPHSIQFYINKLGYYFNRVEANAYRYWYNTSTSPWEPPYLNDYYKFNPQEDIQYYDLTNRSTNISVYDDEPTAILYITQEVNYNYEEGGNEGDQLNGAMITFFSLITGLINLKFGFISIGGILAILFGVALLTFIFKIWNGNNNG